MLFVGKEEDLKFLAMMARIKYGYFLHEGNKVQVYYDYPRNNVAAKLIDNLIKSKHKYYFTTVEKATTDCVINKDNTYDKRFDYKGGKSPGDLPPDNLDGYVVIALNCIHENKGKIVSQEAKAFHELWECYFKVDEGMQYEEAHNKALDMEDLMMEFDPLFTEGSCRGELRCINCTWHDDINAYIP